jgi:hypothetical protein
MKVCEKCKRKFPTWQQVGNKKVNCQRRHYCFTCSPYGGHNCRKLVEGDPSPIEYHCRCGETNPANFPKRERRRTECRNCRNQYNIKCGREKKQKARDLLGGKCLACGFCKYQVSLDIHHLDPTTKDPNFQTMRGWTWTKIMAELKKCILLCRNCHAAVHVGVDVFK